MLAPVGEAQARSLDAGFVMDMPHKQRFGYLSGLVEGLAYARFLRDRPDETGMQCIYDWYYREDGLPSWNGIKAWFNRHPDKPSGALMYVLLKKECGE